MNAPSVIAIQNRFDRAALPQLRDEVRRLHEQNESLDRQLAHAFDDAEFWREQAMALQEQLCAITRSEPGITQGGNLVLVANGSAA